MRYNLHNTGALISRFESTKMLLRMHHILGPFPHLKGYPIPAAQKKKRTVRTLKKRKKTYTDDKAV